MKNQYATPTAAWPREMQQMRAFVREEKTSHNYRSLSTDENTLFFWKRQ